MAEVVVELLGYLVVELERLDVPRINPLNTDGWAMVRGVAMGLSSTGLDGGLEGSVGLLVVVVVGLLVGLAVEGR